MHPRFNMPTRPLVLLTALLPLAPLQAQEAQLHDFLEGYYQAFSDRDWDRFAAHFWPGATLTTVWAPDPEAGERVVVTSVPDFVAQAPLGPGSREIFEERMTSAEFRVFGDLAQAWVHYDARFGDPGDITTWSGIDAFTLVRYGGEWRIASLAYASDGG
jgi:hypothetical protein